MEGATPIIVPDASSRGPVEFAAPKTNGNTDNGLQDVVADTGSNNVVFSHRGGVVENQHHVHAAVVDPSGKLLFTVGNAQRMTLAGSATKPIQALAILETGAAERFDYDDADLALMCASHSSEPRHVDRARAMLKKTGAKEEVLTCGGHPALNPAVNRIWIKQDYTPTSIYSNCSGKHAGMVAGAVSLGISVHDYYMPKHPMQQRIYRTVEETSGLSKDEVKWTIDGCNLPTPAMPLRNLALMYAKLAEAAHSSGHPTKSSLDQRVQHLARIHKSMSSYPELVAGEGRFDMALMQAYRGRVVGKVGADGCYGVAIRGSMDGSNPNSIGVAVKVEDGNLDVLYSSVMEILEQLAVGTIEMRQQLRDGRFPAVVNTAGVVTGGFTHRIKIGKVEDID